MKPTTKFAGIAASVIILFFLLGSVYTIREGQRGILLFLGKIEQDNQTKQAKVINPGLHFKLPFLEDVRLFDIRLQTKDIDESRFVTAEKKDVLVNYYVKWRIENLSVYFTSTAGNAARAETLLAQQLNDGLRAEFGKRTIREVVASGRNDVMASIQKQADASAKNLGIQVIDVRIKRIDLPPEVSSSVYARMGAERERIAAEHRAMGKSKAVSLRANADAKSQIILSKAESSAKKIRGEGDAKAAEIYTQAYAHNAEFFNFYQSLIAYKNSFKPDDWLVLEPNIDFFKYFKSIQQRDNQTHE